MPKLDLRLDHNTKLMLKVIKSKHPLLQFLNTEIKICKLQHCITYKDPYYKALAFSKDADN